MAESWLAAEEIPPRFGITKDTVYDWIADKRIPSYRVGRPWKFRASEIDEGMRIGGGAASESHGDT